MNNEFSLSSLLLNSLMRFCSLEIPKFYTLNLIHFCTNYDNKNLVTILPRNITNDNYLNACHYLNACDKAYVINNFLEADNFPFLT
jgi:hypothetical protein